MTTQIQIELLAAPPATEKVRSDRAEAADEPAFRTELEKAEQERNDRTEEADDSRETSAEEDDRKEQEESRESESDEHPSDASEAATAAVVTPAAELSVAPIGSVRAPTGDHGTIQTTTPGTSQTPTGEAAGGHSGPTDRRGVPAGGEVERPATGEPTRETRQGVKDLRNPDGPTGETRDLEARAANTARELIDPRHLDEATRIRQTTSATRRATANRRDEEIVDDRKTDREIKRVSSSDATAKAEPTPETRTDPRADRLMREIAARAEANQTGPANANTAGSPTPSGTAAATAKAGAPVAVEAAGPPSNTSPTTATGRAPIVTTIANPVPVESILAKVRMHVRPGVKDLRILLDPPELGRLNLRFVMRGESLHVSVLAASTEVVNALKNDLSSFEQTLRDSGVDVSTLDIDLDDGRDRRPDHAAPEEQFGDGPATAKEATSEEDEVSPELTERTGNDDPSGDARIDVTA